MTTIRLRRGTAAEWTSANPVLAAGETGVELDTGQEKFGDGVNAWADLPYVGAGGGGGGLLGFLRWEGGVPFVLTSGTSLLAFPLDLGEPNTSNPGDPAQQGTALSWNAGFQAVEISEPCVLSWDFVFSVSVMTSTLKLFGSGPWPNSFGTVFPIAADSTFDWAGQGIITQALLDQNEGTCLFLIGAGAPNDQVAASVTGVMMATAL